MDDERVTSQSPGNEGGGGKTSPLVCYTKVFKEHYPYYMAMGMSYSDYWDGDCELVVYVRQAFELKREQDNYNAWLQGLYMYNALIAVAPYFNSLTPRKPQAYLQEPIPITAKAIQDKERQRYEDMLERMNKFTDDYNKRRGEV